MNEELRHSAKGTTWKKKVHKYIDIINGRYVYPQEEVKGFDTKKYTELYKQRVSEIKKQHAIEERNRVEEKHKNDKKRPSSKFTSERLQKRANEILSSGKTDSKTLARGKDFLKKANQARNTFWKNAMNSAKGVGQSHSDFYKRAGEGKAKNKTYRKNQRRAKLESLIFKGKRIVKKALSKLGVDMSNRAIQSRKKKKRSKSKITLRPNSSSRTTKKRSNTKVTVTSNLMPAGTKKTIKPKKR
ncbi:MAG: hypothetical protein J6U54_08880 [Clostridiales bacterium]|nr:hypothetical protein [Clostridiales bacterium]